MDTRDELSLIRPGKRLGAKLVLITWVPFAACAVIDRLMHGAWPAEALNLAVHVRLLLAIPLFAVGDHLVHLATLRCSRRFTSSGIVENPELSRRAIAHAMRWRDSRIADVVLAALAFAAGQVALWSATRVGLMETLDVAATWSLTRVFYGLVGFPVFQFLLLRWLLRWSIWSLLLWRWSRQPLRLEAGHPDHAGGIAFSTEPSMAMAPVLAAGSAVLAASWLGQILYGGATARDFQDDAAMVLVIFLSFVFVPLFVFTRQLARARLIERPHLSSFARKAARSFRERVVDAPFDEEVLGKSVMEDMAALHELYGNVQHTRPHPASTQKLALMAGVVLAPMVPVALTAIPLEEAVRKLAETLIGF